MRTQRKTTMKKSAVLAQNSIQLKLFFSYEQFHLPFTKTNKSTHHGWIFSPSLIVLFHYTYTLVEPFTLFITDGSQVVSKVVQM
jgi:hypothetical protein